MSQENVDAVRSSLDGWNRGDIEAWLGSPHPDVEFHTSGVYPGTDPVYKGESELRRFWETFREPWESLHVRVDQIRELGDDVVVLGTFEGHARDGMTVRREVAWIWRFVNDQTVRADSFGSWEEALDAAGLREQAMSQENVAVVRQGWDAWVRGDLPALFRICDPEIVWDTSHFHDWPESAYHGIEGVGRFLNEWLDVWDGYEVDVEDVMAVPDGRVVSLILQRGKGRGSGLGMTMETALVATLRNGKVIRMDNYEDRAEAFEAVGLRE